MPQISASIKPETIKAIKKQAKDEHRTFSAMVAVLLAKVTKTTMQNLPRKRTRAKVQIWCKG